MMIRRGLAFLIDWILICSVGTALFLLGPEFDPEYLIYPSIEMFSAYGVILGVLLVLLFPLFRDVIFGGASLGKRIMGLRIVKKGTREKPSVGALILKNLTFCFVSIEAILCLVNHGFTLGNLISGTEVRRNEVK